MDQLEGEEVAAKLDPRDVDTQVMLAKLLKAKGTVKGNAKGN